MGDPETQNLMLHLDNQEVDFYNCIEPPPLYAQWPTQPDTDLFDKVTDENGIAKEFTEDELKDLDLRLDSDDANVFKADDYCCTIVLAAKGYPGEHEKGFYIDISDIEESKTLKIFHAGTTIDDNKIKVTGGRILTVNVFGKNKNEAINLAYENIKKIKAFEDKDFKIQNQSLVFYRDDIGN
tara:strand:- start:844 stop:1389 length:546 start_codon:yes stop_codon:yes gene_type:complete